ncbi:MAG: hypothetical protein IT340_18090 [Chloroflexi bacterium]|nr:hypothetical protein [Chloroflexota bacterium]
MRQVRRGARAEAGRRQAGQQDAAIDGDTAPVDGDQMADERQRVAASRSCSVGIVVSFQTGIGAVAGQRCPATAVGHV